jgi:hypothetical protein
MLMCKLQIYNYISITCFPVLMKNWYFLEQRGIWHAPRRWNVFTVVTHSSEISLILPHKNESGAH